MKTNNAMYNYILASEEKIKFQSIVPVDELPPGERIFLSIGKASIVLFNIAGAYYAIEDVCSHDDGPVGEGEVEGPSSPAHGMGRNLI